MKNFRSFFRISHSETRRFILLLAVVEFFALLSECAELLDKGMKNTAVLLFIVGIIGIMLVDWFFNNSIDKYKEMA